MHIYNIVISRMYIFTILFSLRAELSINMSDTVGNSNSDGIKIAPHLHISAVADKCAKIIFQGISAP